MLQNSNENLKKWDVKIHLIVGYYPTHSDDEDAQPIIKIERYEVYANDEKEAILKARDLENSRCSIDEEYADEIDEEGNLI